MKKLFTFLTVLIAIQLANAQYVIVNSPASFAGAKTFMEATAGFGRPLLDSIWTADVVYVNDGSATNPAIGCAALTNGASLVGKIALIDRGTCSFSSKVDKAQAAGAIAAIVFNNAPGGSTIPMGITAGFTITIPAVMLSYEDGQKMRATLLTGAVNMTLGNVKFPNDLHVDREKMLNPTNGTTPLSQTDNFVWTPGAAILNNGLNDAFGVDLKGVINFNSPAGAVTEVYNKTTSLPIAESDSTRLIELPVFTPSSGEGLYEIEYTVTSDSADDVASDNTFGSEISITKNVFSKGRWDWDNERPRQTNAYSLASSPRVEFFSGYNIPKGVGYRLDSVQFYVSTQATDLTVLPKGLLNVYVYEWNDSNSDNNFTTGEFTTKSISEVVFNTVGQKSAWVTVPVEDLLASTGGIVIPADNKYYFVGVRYEGDTTIFIGFDEDYDQTAAIDISPNLVYQKDFPYVGASGWSDGLPDFTKLFQFTSLRAALATSLFVNKIITPAETQLAETVSIRLLPNPVSDELVAEVNLTENVISIEYTIIDATGRLVSRAINDVNGSMDKALFNVSKFAPGQYFLKVTTEKGSKTTAFSVQH